MGDCQTEPCAERTHDGHEPCLGAVKAFPGGHTGNCSEAFVTKLDILVEHGHEGVDLAEKLLALVVGLSVGVYLSLAFGDPLPALLESGFALLIAHIAL